MQKEDMMVLGAAAVAVYFITRPGGLTKYFPNIGNVAVPPIPANASYLPDATGLTPPIGTDWVVPGSQQDQMLQAQWP